jgi:hypothetical protein
LRSMKRTVSARTAAAARPRVARGRPPRWPPRGGRQHRRSFATAPGT